MEARGESPTKPNPTEAPGIYNSDVRTQARTNGEGIPCLSDRKTLSAIQGIPSPFVRLEPDIRNYISPTPLPHWTPSTTPPSLPYLFLQHRNAFEKQTHRDNAQRMGDATSAEYNVSPSLYAYL